jgi:hypothetical protein
VFRVRVWMTIKNSSIDVVISPVQRARERDWYHRRLLPPIDVLFRARRPQLSVAHTTCVLATGLGRDGIHFTPTGPLFASRLGMSAGTDGTAIFVDDDGTGYVAFASSPAGTDSPTHPGWPGHIAHNYGHLVSIERMTPDYLHTTRINVTGFFPDDFVESPGLFKRKGVYYLTYGSCCCGCDEGGGQVVFSATAIGGPWLRQTPHADINCRNASAEICGGFSARADNLANLVYNAQWWGPSSIPLANGETQVLYLGRRWLSGPNVPAGCHDICGNNGDPSACEAGGSKYLFKSDLSVWYPLEFDDATGAIVPMRPLSTFTLDLP